MARRPRLVNLIPLALCLLGLTIAILRFRVRDPLGGLVACDAGVLAMVIAARWMPRPPA